MTLAEWKIQWHRLDLFHVSADADRAKVSAEWFAQLQHFHVDAVHAGITELIGRATDTFLPGLGLLKELIRARLGRYEKTPGQCDTCHGSGWVEAPAFMSNHLIYANVVARCSACGIPAPQITSGRREPVPAVQLEEYRSGRYGCDRMPEGMQARSGPRPVTEFAQWAEQLRVKLFGATCAASQEW